MSEKTEKKVAPKKTPPKKAAPKKAAPKKAEVETKEVETKKVEPKETEQKVKKKLDMNELIDVMNNTTGRYKYISRTTGYALEMDEHGDVESIPFSELRTMSSSQKAHIREAYIIILNEDAVAELGYSKLYEGVFDSESVNELLESRDYEKLEAVLPKMPKTMQETVATIAKRRFKSRELSDLNVRDVLEKKLNIKIEV